ncbi:MULTISPECIES: HAD family hydrolase [Marinomonas]|uniref:HAD family hydrolase n=1 Tax=Marinomonas TaxID=28253 RepID=UPI001055EC58|nr:HAD family hydrolase [Marinomonas sp. KMM3893]
MKKVVAFDLDNTLWDVDPVIVRAEYAMESWFEERFPGFDARYPFAVRQEIRKALIVEQPSLLANISAARYEVYKAALKQFGLPTEEADSVAQAALSYFSEWRQKVDLYPHVKEVLEGLQSDYSLIAITNGNADVFHPYVGIGHYFDFAIRADQVGVAKPDSKLFELAADKAGVSVERIVHIGDHPIDDVAGAARAGIKSIWFNRHGARRWDDQWSLRSDIEVHSILELPEAVRLLLP